VDEKEIIGYNKKFAAAVKWNRRKNESDSINPQTMCEMQNSKTQGYPACYL